MIENGNIAILQESYNLGERLTYECDLGFGSRDDLITECQILGNSFIWTLDATPPSCLRCKYILLSMQFPIKSN